MLSLSHLSDGSLRRELVSLATIDRMTTARLLAHLAEFDTRRLHLEDGYPSLFAYCLQELRFSEDMAFKRIRVARAARRFPALLEAIAEGRMNLSCAVLLAPYLKPENVQELLAAATHKTRAEVELLLAQRFPRPDVPALLRALPFSATPGTPDEVAPGPPGPPSSGQLVPERVDQVVPCTAGPASRHEVAPGPVRAPVPPPRLAPLAPRRFALQVTIDQSTHDKLRRAQDLIGHQIPSGDVAQVLDKALDALIERLEKAKCGATSRPRRSPPPSTPNPRYVPAQVKRQVWQRDGGRCTYVSDSGRRCPGRKFLEYDHVLEVARGGAASAANIRLRCLAHNQHAAERTFGIEFMRARRESSVSP